MQIGVISDTHLKRPDKLLQDVADRIFRDVAMVLHAGDLTHIDVISVFNDRDTVTVRGNMDRTKSVSCLPETKIIEILGYRIGLIHGWGGPRGIQERIVKRFDRVDAIVYGHTHKAAIHDRGGTLLFNPGAFAGSFLLGRNRSVGLLELSEKGISASIVPVG
jgi:putative phosphoesterase